MYHTQSQPIPEWFTYSDSGAQDEQNDYLLHQVFFNSVEVLVLGPFSSLISIKGPMYRPQNQRIPERSAYSDSEASRRTK